jgi:hypothetical protein
VKNLQVVTIETEEEIALRNTSLLLENLTEIQKLESINWKDFPYKPAVSFRIGHAGKLILIKFYVTEKSIRAAETEVNGKVYQDSCVEFFLSLDGIHYYNFEFNCIGTPHVGWGTGCNDRQHLPVDVVKNIQIKSSLGNLPFDTKTGSITWDLVAVIPVECFIHDQDLDLTGMTCSANFYKCGDLLPEPHFLTWNPVGTPQPDYHRPEFFGKIHFE